MTPNIENLKPFVKNDPRINRKGTPKNFKQLRRLVVDLASEETKEDATRIVNMLRKMFDSDNPSDKALLLKYGFGNVPDETDITSGGEKITVTIKSVSRD
jgi:hypothetical protein